MMIIRISNGGLTITGEHFDTEANLDNIQQLDDTYSIDNTNSIDDASETQAILEAIFGITTSEVQTDNIRLDTRGNLLAQVVENPSATKISIDQNKVITVKTLTTGGM